MHSTFENKADTIHKSLRIYIFLYCPAYNFAIITPAPHAIAKLSSAKKCVIVIEMQFCQLPSIQGI